MLFSLPSFSKEKQNGQAVLIILLTVSIILVIGFSVASRSVTDIKLSQQTEESTRVFWAAQAGLEQAIKANTNVADSSNPSTINDNIDYFVSKSIIGGTSPYVFDDSTTGKIGSGEIRYLWLRDHTADGEIETTGYGGTGIKISWGEESKKPAIEINLVYLNSNIYYLKIFTVDTQVRSPETKFTMSVSCGSSGSYICTADVDFGLPPSSSPYLISFKPFYLSSGEKIPLKVESIPSGGFFPNQGSCFESVATHEVSNITRRLKECQTWKQPTQIGYLLFSNSGGIEK